MLTYLLLHQLGRYLTNWLPSVPDWLESERVNVTPDQFFHMYSTIGAPTCQTQ